MSAIKIPYLPISSFEESDVCEKYVETSREENGYLKFTREKTLLFPDQKDLCTDVALVLHGIGMEKYVQLFEGEKISMETFLLLNESDLEELGISDEKDRKIIIENLEVHRTDKEFGVSENHEEDLRIAKNVFNQLLLIQNYCAYVELQMKKHKLTDYRIGKKDTACEYLKAFTESAITQSKRLSNLLFDGSHSDNLIGKVHHMYSLSLPQSLQEKLKNNKRSNSTTLLKVMVVVGVCSMILFGRKYLFRRK